MKISIQIATKDRRDDLTRTLAKLSKLLSDDVECRVIDDGSIDGTYGYVKAHFPEIEIQRNEYSKGHIYCRNLMLNNTDADIVISLDDDAEFLTPLPLDEITEYFKTHPECGLTAFRIFWGLDAPELPKDQDSAHRVNSFVGCGHAWRVSAWREIPDYAEWFQFYGEENFAALNLFKKNIEIHYLPSVFVHHRVNMLARQQDKTDRIRRFRKGLRADWYIFLLFYPIGKAVRKILSSCLTQLRTKIIRGNVGLAWPLIQAWGDIIWNYRRIRRNRNVLSETEYESFMKLPPAKIYWKP